MDPVSHLLFGRTVALTVPQRAKANGMTAALVIGSIAPDVDGVLAFKGFDLYLRAHASGTHSIAGALVVAAVLGVILRRFVRDSTFVPLVAASWVGTIGHILCDLADDGDIAVFQPFSGAVVGWHLFPMGDLLVLAVLVVTVLGALRWTRAPQYAGMCGLLALTCLTGLKIRSQQMAIAHYREMAEVESVIAPGIRPQIGLFDWMIYDRAGDRVRGWRVDAWNGRSSVAFERHDAADGPLVDASRGVPVVRRFFGFASLPFARVEADGPRDLILWSDARWCSLDRCDLSFGVAFEAGVPLYQLIRIGPFTQTQPIRRRRVSRSRRRRWCRRPGPRPRFSRCDPFGR